MGRLLRFKHRLADRRKAPRKWWFPIPPDLKLPEGKRLAEVHEETSKTIRRTLFALITFSFFCVFLLLGTPDRDLIAEGSKIQVPIPLVADYEMPFVGFLIVGPVVLIAITIYLHNFVRHWLTLGEVPAENRVPYLFNLPCRPSRWLSGFLFYWLTPTVLAVFVWQTLPQPFGAGLFALFVVVTSSSWWLQQMRRDPAPSKTRRRILNGVVLILWAAGVLYGGPFYPRLSSIRTLNLFKADLSGQDLRDRYLAGADLSGANLHAAELSGASLFKAKLTVASLYAADLSGADLSKAEGLTQEQLETAYGDAEIKLPEGLTRPEHWAK